MAIINKLGFAEVSMYEDNDLDSFILPIFIIVSHINTTIASIPVNY
jgi:hypothetical protein